MGLFLHQTTTMCSRAQAETWLFMGLFLHQTTTLYNSLYSIMCCLWVFSYIKPQHLRAYIQKLSVVYGSFPTSNHNHILISALVNVLFMGLFLHQTTTVEHVEQNIPLLFMGLFLHQTTTNKAYSSRC